MKFSPQVSLDLHHGEEKGHFRTVFEDQTRILTLRMPTWDELSSEVVNYLQSVIRSFSLSATPRKNSLIPQMTYVVSGEFVWSIEAISNCTIYRNHWVGLVSGGVAATVCLALLCKGAAHVWPYTICSGTRTATAGMYHIIIDHICRTTKATSM